jgi:hypothetical protein
MMREPDPAKKPQFVAIVANPQFSLRSEPTDAFLIELGLPLLP